MLDRVLGAQDQQLKTLIEQMRTLYRARPFTKSVPFQIQLTADEVVEIWSPKNSFFEVGKIIIRATVAGADLSFLDTSIGSPFAFAMPPTTIYQEIDLSPGYRSLSASQARLLVQDANSTGALIKGAVLGWEVNPNGDYR